jgi:Domain of unknown function (DUF4276)
MHLELLVEEASAEAALRNIVPRIIGPNATFAVHPHEGKADLCAKLPGRLRGYRAWLPDDWRIMVLIDEDRADCVRQKNKLQAAARDAGLLTRSAAHHGRPYQLVNRVAVEELEAWFFGDVSALTVAYPGVPPTLGRQAKYRDPDRIGGGTWEALQRVLQKAGYFPGGLPKIEVARSVSMHMDPDRNRSKSFQVFRDALRALATGAAPAGANEES